ncbi:MAG: hypothetical protein J2O39_02605 [Acidimicrobiales bacterium]|nr:hypothetical protein [Acidimicrobiales bacterium]MBO0886219.1 hypothetical protein [Acidimicrobiales bacterium]MBO0893242.1 hypothetical protein [Acidimicrobiales bacterium]
MSERGATPVFSCVELEQVAGELGLGVLGGLERAAALAHVESCPRCRTLVEEAVQLGERLLELGPEAQPPVGFESRVVARQNGPIARGRRRDRRRWAVLGAGAGAAATAAGLFLGLGLPGGQGHQPAAISASTAAGTRTAPLMSDHGEVGQVFVVAGKPTWVFMTVMMSGSSQMVSCQVITTSGQHLDLGSFPVSDTYRSSWSSALDVNPASIKSVQLVAPGGQVLSHASL